jgi:hypothetical protein
MILNVCPQLAEEPSPARRGGVRLDVWDALIVQPDLTAQAVARTMMS